MAAGLTPPVLTPPILTPGEFQRLTDVSRETLARLKLYVRLLEKWQGAINLVSGTSLEDVWRRHLLDAAQLARYIADDAAGQDTGGRERETIGAKTIVDLGSGAGFPGLVLAIMALGEVHLVESDQRKCAFLSTVARETATEVTIHPLRIETLTPFPADIVTARAFAPLDQLIGYAEPFIGSRGQCLFLKGKRAAEELTLAAKLWNMRIDRFASVSDPSGVVLRLREVSRTRSHGQ